MALPAVPPVADADRVVNYNVATPTSVFAVPWPVFGDGSDLAVSVNGLPATVNASYVFSSASGTPVSSLSLPITDGRITFNTPVAAGTVTIYGQWHPRQSAISTSPAIQRREFQQIIGQLVTGMRENFTRIQSLLAIVGNAATPVFPPATGVFVSQLKQALAAVDTGARPAVAANIPNNPYSAVNIAWNGTYTVVGDALSRFVQVQMGYTNGQIAALYTTAATFPVNPP